MSLKQDSRKFFARVYQRLHRATASAKLSLKVCTMSGNDLIAVLAAAREGNEPAWKFVNNQRYRYAVEHWRDSATGFNLLQYAILNQTSTEMVEILFNYFDFYYRHKSSNVVSFEWEKIANGTQLVPVNAPLHLACKLHNFSIVKMILETSNHVMTLLEMRSIIDLSNNKGPDGRSKVKQEAKSALEVSIDNHFIEGCIEIAESIFRYKVSHYYNCYFGTCYDTDYWAWDCDAPGVKNPLHIACYIKIPAYLDLLLQDDYYRKEINTADPCGKPPLYIVLENYQCLEILLRHKADHQVIIGSKNLLQWLLMDRQWMDCNENARNTLQIARLLIEYDVPVNVNWARETEKYQTPIDFIMCHFNKYYRLAAHDEFQPEILIDYINLLFDGGGKKAIRIQNKGEDKQVCTISTICLNHLPKNVNLSYAILKTILERGALDLNHVTSIGDGTKQRVYMFLIKTYIIDLQPMDQINLLHLLWLYGANYNNSPPLIHTMRKRYIIRQNFSTCFLGFIFTNVIRGQRIRVKVLSAVLDFVSLTTLNKCLPTMIEQKGLLAEQCKFEGTLHILDVIFYNQRNTVRTLLHMCKLVVIRSLKLQIQHKLQVLDIPKELKTYLWCNVF